MKRIPWLFALLALLVSGPASADKDLDRLVRKSDMVLRGKTSAGVFKMEIKTASYSRSFTIVMWDDRQGKERSLIKILGPALWRGYSTLKVGSQLKLFNPRANRVTVVGSSMLGNAWMGSHFTNDDLVKETSMDRHFNSKLAKKWKKGDRTHYRILLTPKPTAPIAWGKIVMEVWEKGPLVIPTSWAYFRKAKQRKPDRVMWFSEVKLMGGRMVPAVMKVTVTKKPGEYTSITYKSIKFDIKIPSSKFSEQALRH